jgi:hypothetical protein
LPDVPADAATSTRALVSFAPVRNLLGYSTAVNAGVMLQATALGKQIYDITGRELDIGLLGLAEFLPAALLVLVTGSRSPESSLVRSPWRCTPCRSRRRCGHSS